jgi:trimeric autotransporter adhesin
MMRIRWAIALIGALVALATGGGARAALTITTAVSTAADPHNGSLLPKAIPDATMSYTVTVANALFQSTARNVTVSSPIPAKLKFYVGTGNPVTVTIGALSSLTYSYVSLWDTGDGLEFSKDGGTDWSYKPVAGTDGSDPLVTNVRVKTGGSQVAGDSFTISYKAIVR